MSHRGGNSKYIFDSLIRVLLGPTNVSFIPLKDLLRKNHDDRVIDYMSKMKGMTIEEIVNGKQAFEEGSSSRVGDQTPRQKQILNSLRKDTNKGKCHQKQYSNIHIIDLQGFSTI